LHSRAPFNPESFAFCLLKSCGFADQENATRLSTHFCKIIENKPDKAYGRNMLMTDERIDELKAKLRKFRDDRDWKQFHNPKDLAISIAIEAGELLEEFQWKDKEGVERKVREERHKVEEEMADIYIYLLELSDVLGVDLVEAAGRKMAKNAVKYPVEKAKGNSRKYTEL
jgi:NTP pyrophosphatase (non-canonical NTP hydrolase)